MWKRSASSAAGVVAGVSSPPRAGGVGGAAALLLAEDPRREQMEACVRRDEDAALDAAALGEGALDPPGRVLRQLDTRLPAALPDPPRRALAGRGGSAG